ncbi:MAG: 3-phosphoshikimate 1-carboxyvinyltransferase [Patescibacteria group bacterium]|nr:3-phosphoshikimate 1-carboxyvinyltransferase [Patescibacteria group bacterium]
MKLKVPPSKSITQRALLISHIAGGKVTNPLLSDDTKHMIKALKNLKSPIFVGNAGTAMRFLTAYLTLTDFKGTITGNKHMQKRPIKELVNALNKLGAKVSTKNGCPPVHVEGAKGLKGGKVRIKGNISSQYISAILMVAPYAEKDVVIEVIGNLASKPYVDLTIDVMKAFGVHVKNKNYKRFTVKTGQKYKTRKFKVEGDASSATYFWAISHLTGRKIDITNISKNSKQGDIKFKSLLKKLQKRIDLNDMPDTMPLVAALCALKKGKRKMVNIANLRIKECDRIEAMRNELKKLGIKTKSGKDWLEVEGAPDKIRPVKIETYNDHRIAMTFAALKTKYPKIEITGKSCVSKSYPNFWKDYKRITK